MKGKGIVIAGLSLGAGAAFGPGNFGCGLGVEAGTPSAVGIAPAVAIDLAFGLAARSLAAAVDEDESLLEGSAHSWNNGWNGDDAGKEPTLNMRFYIGPALLL